MHEPQQDTVGKATAPPKTMRNNFWLLLAVLGFIALAALLAYLNPVETEAPVATPSVVREQFTAIEPKPELVQGQQSVRESEKPVIEVAPVPSQSALIDTNPELVADLHALNDSSRWHAWTDTEDLIRKSSVILDNLARGDLVLKPLPIARPKQSFKVMKQGNKLFLDPANYTRYDVYVEVLRALDTRELAVLYRRYLPLLEQSYAELEDADEDVDKRITDSFDFLLSTPVLEGPVQLQIKGGIYQFSDPALEALPAVQKQLIRMGPENTKVLLDQVARLKQALVK